MSDIQHRERAHRFSLRLGDELAYLDYDAVDDTTLDYAHVWVPPTHRGGGIAAELTRTALDYARANDKRIIPTCPYVAAYLGRHPEYKDLLAPDSRGTNSG